LRTGGGGCGFGYLGFITGFGDGGTILGSTTGGGVACFGGGWTGALSEMEEGSKAISDSST